LFTLFLVSFLNARKKQTIIKSLLKVKNELFLIFVYLLSKY